MSGFRDEVFQTGEDGFRRAARRWAPAESVFVDDLHGTYGHYHELGPVPGISRYRNRRGSRG
jgi:hypothetical protein